MGLKIIDEKVLNMIREKIMDLHQKTILQKKRSLDDWLDNQDVCLLLNVSLRTLQSYRDRGILTYAMIGHKCYYKNSDVMNFIESRKSNNNLK